MGDREPLRIDQRLTILIYTGAFLAAGALLTSIASILYPDPTVLASEYGYRTFEYLALAFVMLFLAHIALKSLLKVFRSIHEWKPEIGLDDWERENL